MIGLGLLGLGQLLLIAAVGLAGRGRDGGARRRRRRADAPSALALVWFVLGYAFYACLFACAGALVPRQEELQASTTPLTLMILISFFVAFAVSSTTRTARSRTSSRSSRSRAPMTHAAADRARRGVARCEIVAARS